MGATAPIKCRASWIQYSKDEVRRILLALVLLFFGIVLTLLAENNYFAHIAWQTPEPRPVTILP